MSTNLQLILDATSGNLQFVPITSGGSGTPGGADTNIQFNNSGVFGGSDKFVYDKASAVTLKTLTDADTANTVFNLGVHANEANAAALSVSVDGNSGNNTPDTTFIFPGAALFNVLDTINYSGNSTGNGMSVNAANATTTAGDGITYNIATLNDAATGPAAFILGVHVIGANAAGFSIEVDGASGNNTPDTSFLFPGASKFTGASGYSFDNTVNTTAYSVNGNAGASGTGTVISAITVENGIITAITVV